MFASLTNNEVREWATAYWPHVGGADWDGKTLSLKYGSHWHKCSEAMPVALDKWIKRGSPGLNKI